MLDENKIISLLYVFVMINMNKELEEFIGNYSVILIENKTIKWRTSVKFKPYFIYIELPIEIKIML